jgi:hypothetical protein
MAGAHPYILLVSCPQTYTRTRQSIFLTLDSSQLKEMAQRHPRGPLRMLVPETSWLS